MSPFRLSDLSPSAAPGGEEGHGEDRGSKRGGPRAASHPATEGPARWRNGLPGDGTAPEDAGGGSPPVCSPNRDLGEVSSYQQMHQQGVSRICSSRPGGHGDPVAARGGRVRLELQQPIARRVPLAGTPPGPRPAPVTRTCPGPRRTRGARGSSSIPPVPSTSVELPNAGPGDAAGPGPASRSRA